MDNLTFANERKFMIEHIGVTPGILTTAYLKDSDFILQQGDNKIILNKYLCSMLTKVMRLKFELDPPANACCIASDLFGGSVSDEYVSHELKNIK